MNTQLMHLYSLTIVIRNWKSQQASTAKRTVAPQPTHTLGLLKTIATMQLQQLLLSPSLTPLIHISLDCQKTKPSIAIKQYLELVIIAVQTTAQQ